MRKIALLYTLLREEEKLILNSAKKKGVEIELINILNTNFNPKTFKLNFDLALDRSVSIVKGLYATQFLESLGKLVINMSKVSLKCADKFLTSLALEKFKVPQPKFALVFSLKEAKKAVEELGGFPVVLKPTLGSWGRMVAKVNDIDALEALIEDREIMGSAQQKAYYLQEYVKKPGRDIRAFVFDGEVLCAIFRESDHWITNTARGGKASNCPITDELRKICKLASDAIGGGILGIDILETDEGLKVNEINHTTEFRNAQKVTGIPISDYIVDYCLKKYGG